MKFTLLSILLSLFLSAELNAAGMSKDTTKTSTPLLTEEMLTDEYLDTVTIKKSKLINDYTMIGVQYGMGLSQVTWNPKRKQDMVLIPYNIGITYTRYGKMFGYMPFFGFQAGFFHGYEGYQLDYNKKKQKSNYKIEGAEKAIIEMVEMPLMAHMHIDFWKMKIMANIGCYGGYRLSIERVQMLRPEGYRPSEMESFEKYRNSFTETDRRWDYGIKGGVGFGFIFDPVEIHLTAAYKHSFSSLYQPDHYSKYFYRFGYPANLVISAGVHFQLTKRTGKTKAELKRLAKEMVYGNDANQNR